MLTGNDIFALILWFIFIGPIFLLISIVHDVRSARKEAKRHNDAWEAIERKANEERQLAEHQALRERKLARIRRRQLLAMRVEEKEGKVVTLEATDLTHRPAEQPQ